LRAKELQSHNGHYVTQFEVTEKRNPAPAKPEQIIEAKKSDVHRARLLHGLGRHDHPDDPDHLSDDHPARL
jgi:hypothetical protein